MKSIIPFRFHLAAVVVALALAGSLRRATRVTTT
jgi:hypothetical protein